MGRPFRARHFCAKRFLREEIFAQWIFHAKRTLFGPELFGAQFSGLGFPGGAFIRCSFMSCICGRLALRGKKQQVAGLRAFSCKFDTASRL
jgi:hypothetical protein